MQVDEFRREGIVFGTRLLHGKYQSLYGGSVIKKRLTVSFRNSSQGTKRICSTSLLTLAASFLKPAPGSHFGMWRTEWQEILIRLALKKSVIDQHTTWNEVQEELEKRVFSTEPNSQGFLVGHKQSLFVLFGQSLSVCNLDEDGRHGTVGELEADRKYQANVTFQ